MLDAVPYDILSVVIEYLPVRDVEKLCAVNRRLRNAVGLDARFGEVKFDKHDPRMKGLCEMLCRGDIAAHVRRLTIEPWLVQPGTKTYVSRSENAWNHINTFFNPNYMEQQAERRVRKRIRKDIGRVTTAVRRLQNVEEYHIVYNERSRYHRQFFDAFLSPTLETFAPTLTKLTIKVPFDLLPHLSYVRLPKLRDLDISLCTGEARMDDIKYALDGFFVFLHNLLALEHLGISVTSSSRGLDLSYFSKRWGKFPNLKSFGLCIPFDGGILSSPEDLYKHVVEPHAQTLEKLKLSTTCCGVPLGSLPPDCHYWIQRILKLSLDTDFPHLGEIELALRPLRANLDDLQTFLKKRAPTLRKLCLTDRVLHVHELAELFKSLCPSDTFPTGRNDVLMSLKIKIDVLSPTLLVLIAQRFPELRTLGLAFADVWCDVPDPKSHNLSPQQKLYAAFVRSLQPYKPTLFATWGLHNLNIVEGPPSFPWLHALERVFVDCFRSLINVGELPRLTI